MTPLILFLIAIPVVLAFIIFIYASEKNRYNKTLPKEELLFGVRINYLENTTKLEHINLALSAVNNVLSQKYPNVNFFRNLWIYVYPNDYDLIEKTGKIKVKGTLDKIKFWGLKTIWIVRFKQISENITKTTFFHELIEHHVPNTLGLSLNFYHESKWHELEQEVVKEFLRLKNLN